MSVIYFYGHNRGDYRCFSNFYPIKFTDGEISYCCSEQYLMAHKALLMGDGETHAMIMATHDPKVIKSLGRQVKGFNQGLWDQHKYAIMVRALVCKFSDPDCAAILKGTGDAVLVEAAANDTIWGIGISEADAKAGKPWRGENLLGKALMEVRANL